MLTDNADFVAEEIKTYKQMLDDGLISEEECNQKHKKLLGL
ncbi:MAG TPA: SHOCT domain-containing protein [Bacilli bacterium]|nr:SHOCT domain-containing protein [Acholeplasmataceae bacterium]HOA79102.1 SHOCT domain-containing protein [Bacilli bacterium]HPZ27622.1 SHOCT domain-containing protein [Bacilli bacterium]HQC89893.1 SHOCT domain-containing protein [Bacilli bacterium]